MTATPAQLNEIIKQAAPKISEKTLGARIITRAHERYTAEADRDAFLSSLGLVYNQTPPAGWLGVGQGPGGMPIHDPMPAGASPECAVCVLEAWAVLSAMLAAAELLTEPSRSILIDLAWEVFDAMTDECPCDAEW